MPTNEAFSRVKIDAQLSDQGWEVENPNAVRFEYPLPDAARADYVLCDHNGRSLAVIEAKRSATNPADAAGQARAYAEQLGVPFIFLVRKLTPSGAARRGVTEGPALRWDERADQTTDVGWGRRVAIDRPRKATSSWLSCGPQLASSTASLGLVISRNCHDHAE